MHMGMNVCVCVCRRIACVVQPCPWLLLLMDDVWAYVESLCWWGTTKQTREKHLPRSVLHRCQVSVTYSILFMRRSINIAKCNILCNANTDILRTIWKRSFHQMAISLLALMFSPHHDCIKNLQLAPVMTKEVHDWMTENTTCMCSTYTGMVWVELLH